MIKFASQITQDIAGPVIPHQSLSDILKIYLNKNLQIKKQVKNTPHKTAFINKVFYLTTAKNLSLLGFAIGILATSKVRNFLIKLTMMACFYVMVSEIHTRLFQNFFLEFYEKQRINYKKFLFSGRYQYIFDMSLIDMNSIQ